MTSITGFGAYIPRLRLSRQAAVDANGWFNPAIRGLAKGERAMANWDEDALTMAVEAARDCLQGADSKAMDTIAGVTLASTTLPYQDRLNAGVLAAALNLPEDGIATQDVTASQRAATSALIQAMTGTLDGAPRLLIASDKRRTKAAGSQELLFGDGAAALMIGGPDAALVDCLASYQTAVDFVDHYRGQDEAYDYFWEERWIRDEGYFKIVPRTLEGLFAKTTVTPADIDHFVMPSVMGAVPRKLAKMVGVADTAVADTLHGSVGETGAAHPMLLLNATLEKAAPGQTILLIGWGHGCDAVLLRTTDALAGYKAGLGVAGHIARGRTETNYNKYLAFNELVLRDKGIRAELDKSTALSALYRKRAMLTGFVGGKCSKCGTAQFPKSNVCVNPNCGAFHTQEDHPFANIPAKVQSWTADNLTYSPSPPAHFGMVVFEEGGRLMADFTDVDPGQVSVDMPMKMVFRIKEHDDQRGFSKYFWKAAPDTSRTGG